jgi:type I restriction enzyme S subunit
VLDEMLAKSTWRTIAFGRAVERSKKSQRSDLQPLSVFLDQGVVPRASRDDNHNRLGADLDKYLVVEPGDIVFNKLRTWQGGFGRSKHHGIVSPAYFVCRPHSGWDSSFLHYLLHSSPYVAELTRVSKFMPPSQFDIMWDDLKLIPIPVPPLSTQRAIADYLDVETARIDALIEKKRRMMELVEQRFWSAFVDRTCSVEAADVPLRRCISSIVDGPFGSSLTSGHYSESGARVVRLGNIGFAEFDDNDKAYIPIDHYRDLFRHRVEAGDLLIAGLGDSKNHTGRACVAPDLGDALVKADCYRARVNQDRSTASFLAYYLSSPLGSVSVALVTRGTTRSRINLDIAKDIPVPLVPLIEQLAISNWADAERREIRSLQSALRTQINLLVEHRQALITAAVTGELHIPGVAA